MAEIDIVCIKSLNEHYVDLIYVFHEDIPIPHGIHMGWLWLVGSIKL